MNQKQEEQPVLLSDSTSESSKPHSSALDLLDFKKTVRIAVTGDVQLTAAETAVIDTSSFQRLRGVSPDIA